MNLHNLDTRRYPTDVHIVALDARCQSEGGKPFDVKHSFDARLWETEGADVKGAAGW